MRKKENLTQISFEGPTGHIKSFHVAIFSKYSIICYLVTIATEHPRFKEGTLTGEHKREIQVMAAENPRFKSNSATYYLCNIGKLI